MEHHGEAAPVATLEQFMAGTEIKPSVVFIDELKTGVKIRPLTLGDRKKARSAASIAGGERLDPEKYQAVVVSLCMIEPKLDPKQADALMERNVKVIDHIFKEIVRLSGQDVDKVELKNGSAPTLS